MMKHWDITSDPARLREVRLELEHFAQGIGMSVEASHAVGLVLNEALAAEKGDAELKVVIRDWAKPFDPATIKARREDELKPGGLGMICIRKLMDGFRYERLSDGMQLTMSKKIA